LNTTPKPPRPICSCLINSPWWLCLYGGGEQIEPLQLSKYRGQGDARTAERQECRGKHTAVQSRAKFNLFIEYKVLFVAESGVIGRGAGVALVWALHATRADPGASV
jgi:hypothetical protein